MDKLQKLLDLRNHKVHSLKDLANSVEQQNRSMTAEEVALFDRLEGEIKDLDQQITAAQATKARADKVASIEAGLNSPAGRQTAVDVVGTPIVAGEPVIIIPAGARSRPLKAFKGPKAEQNAYRAGMWARAVLLGDEKAVNWCVQHGMRNALGTTDNSKGGVLVPEEMSTAIIDLREMYGVYRRNTHVVPMGRDVMTIPRRLSGVTIGPVGENPSAAPTATDPTWNGVQLVAKKCGGLTKYSTEIAEDAVIDIGEWIAQEFAYALSLYEDTLGFTGAGSAAHLGIRGLTTLMTISLGLAGAVACPTATHDTFSEIDLTDLTTAMAKLPEYAKPNAKWYCSSVFDELVFGRLLASAGGNTIQTLSDGRPQRRFLGYPVEISQVLPNGPSTDYSGLPMCFFGDLSKASTLGDRRQIRVFPSEHRYMDTDQIGVFVSARLDIVNHDLGDTSTVGPMVALCGGAS